MKIESGRISSLTACCPRCGYDQRGVIATWTESCPLHGTCSECGLEFEWALVTQPRKFEPQWCVEFTSQKGLIPLACVKTLAHSCFPVSFWTRMQMSHRIRPLRLVIYVSLLLLPLVLSYVLAGMTLAANTRAQLFAYANASTAWNITYVQSQLSVLKAAKDVRHASPDEKQRILDSLPQAMPKGAMIPMANGVIERWSNQSTDELESHIATFEAMLATYQSIAATPPALNLSSWDAFVELVVFPLSDTSSGMFRLPDGSTMAYHVPADIWNNALNNFGAGPAGWVLGGRAFAGRSAGMQAIVNCGLAVLLAILFPLTFILLPVSRRKAKVRWGHVGRIFAYSLVTVEALVIVFVIAGLAQLYTQSRYASSLLVYGILGFVIVLPLWWACAIRFYLKMPHAGWIASLMMLVLLLLLSPWLQDTFPSDVVRWILG